ncbi:hypothetical protein Leryth_027220 [Lithospermum erythrorhizon]|nr:hypothetical protein Leryth_027220 [Lithospermum erythrorhizon]
MSKKLSSILLLLGFYFVATFFFCHGDDASVINCSANDLEALLDFKSGINDPEGRLLSWKSESNCCQWSGIRCDNKTGAVINVDLHNLNPGKDEDHIGTYGFWNLSGEIRPSLLKLESLRYLDLSCNSFEGITIPEFLGSLNNLQYLNLSKAGFVGSVPPTLGNLSSLQYLDISSDYSQSLVVNNFQWMRGLVSLKILDFTLLNLSSIEVNWLEILNMLPYLTEIHLQSTSLPAGSISSLSYINFTSLAVIDLSANAFNDLFPSWLVNVSSLTYVNLLECSLRGRIPLGFSELLNLRYFNLALNYNLSVDSHKFLGGSWNKIEYLILDQTNVHGKFPSTIGNMTYLTYFDMSSCNLEGGIPSSIGKLCNLTYLDLSGNILSGSLPESLEGYDTCRTSSPLPCLVNLELTANRLMGKLPDWLGQLFNLQQLGIGGNLLEGPIPDSIGRLRNLESITLALNKLSGPLPESFGQLEKLSILDISSNELRGIVSENHFARAKSLEILQLYSNSLTLNFSSNWLPPFQVRNLGLGSCKLGPSFPSWLQHHKAIQFLDLSNASISGPVPEWFWDLSFNLSLLNFSHNQLQGKLPNPIMLDSFADLDLSFNFFEGTIPLPMNQETNSLVIYHSH